MTTTFKVTHTDDYREGPALYTEKLSDDSDDESSSDEEYTISYEIDIKKTTNYVIYYIYMGIGDCKLKKLAERETKEEAEEFAKQQYKLYTGDYPFITSGYSSAYHPEGEPFILMKNRNVLYLKETRMDMIILSYLMEITLKHIH